MRTDQMADEPSWPADVRVVMYDTLSGTNEYSVELIKALKRYVPLTVVTVDNTRLVPVDCHRLLAVIPAFAKPRPRWRKAFEMGRAYLSLCVECLSAPSRTILHVQFLRFERLESRLFALLRGLGVKIVFSGHNALPHDRQPWHAAFYRRWYESVDMVHVLSRSVLDEIEESVGARPRRSARIGHGPYAGMKARHASIDPAARRRKLGIDTDRFVILQYGLFKRYKGVDRLADALIALPEDMRPLLILAGGGPIEYRTAVREKIEAAGRADCLLWLEHFVDDDELCGLLTIADLVVFPYVKVSQSGALYLAMTFEKACLCSDLPGFREALPPNPLLYVDTADTGAFTERLMTLISSPKALEESRAAVTSAAEAGFEWDWIARETTRMYLELLTRR